MIEINEIGTGYSERTKLNAQSASLTVAFATDFETAGERLTARSASRTKYLGLLLTEVIDVTNMADAIGGRLWYLSKNSPKTLNIAGNGIYTLERFGITQADINDIIYATLYRVTREHSITRIYTGGQTGVDQAGVIAALALGIPVEVNMPKGYKRRDKYGVNYFSSVDGLMEEYIQQVEGIRYG